MHYSENLYCFSRKKKNSTKWCIIKTIEDDINGRICESHYSEIQTYHVRGVHLWNTLFKSFNTEIPCSIYTEDTSIITFVEKYLTNKGDEWYVCDDLCETKHNDAVLISNLFNKKFPMLMSIHSIVDAPIDIHKRIMCLA